MKTEILKTANSLAKIHLKEVTMPFTSTTVTYIWMDWGKSHTNLSQGSIAMQWREVQWTVGMTALETSPFMPSSYGKSTSPTY